MVIRAVIPTRRVKMALHYQAWEADGPIGEAEIGGFRSDQMHINMTHLSDYLKSWKDNDSCVRITKTRTEKNGITVDVWVRPGYKDPFVID